MKYLIAAVLVVVIGGCSNSDTLKEPKSKYLQNLDYQECLARGFDEDTPLFEQCMFALEEIRAAREMRQIKQNIQDIQRLRQDSRDRNF